MRRLDTTLLRHDKMNETSRSSGFSDRANLTGWSLKDLNREGARVYLGVIHNMAMLDVFATHEKLCAS